MRSGEMNHILVYEPYGVTGAVTVTGTGYTNPYCSERFYLPEPVTV